MFKERNIIGLRATSLIPPEIWNDEFMRAYDEEQRKVVDYLNDLKRTNNFEYNRMMNVIGTANWFSENESDWFKDVIETNFERIFIVKSEHVINPDSLKKLVELIASQSKYMKVKITFEEKIPLEDLKDFGIAISKEGDILLYELIIIGKNLYGGKITCNPRKIKEAINRYKMINALSSEIPANSEPHSLISIIDQIMRTCGAEIKEEIVEEVKGKIFAGHICLRCFLRTERIMGLMDEEELKKLPPSVRNWAENIEVQDWRKFKPEMRCWYEMIDIENRKVIEHVKRERPRRIVEVGCGPGRLISQILKIKGYEYDEIVGIDGNLEMSEIARNRFKAFPKVSIYWMTVVDKLPIPVNDYFDFCINAMNIVGWQEGKEKEWLKEMLRCSNTVFFTVYKKGYEKERIAMYQTRGHTLNKGVCFDEKTGQIQLVDCATNPGVRSCAYDYETVENICQEVKSRYEPEYEVTYEIDNKSNDLLYLCFLYKKKRNPKNQK